MQLSRIFTAITAAALFGSGNAGPMIQNSVLQARQDLPTAEILYGVQNLTVLTSTLTTTVSTIASYNVLSSFIGLGPLAETLTGLTYLILSTTNTTALINGTAPVTSSLNNTLVDQILDGVSAYAVANQYLLTTLMSKASMIAPLIFNAPVALYVAQLGVVIDLLIAAIIVQLPTYTAALTDLGDSIEGIIQSTISAFG